VHTGPRGRIRFCPAINLLVTIGSHGDVHPFAGLGAALMRRGHRATLVTNGHFEPMARKLGLDFVESVPAKSTWRLARNPELWTIKGGFKVVFSSVANLLPRVYDAIVPRIDSETTVVGSSLALSARVAQEHMGSRWRRCTSRRASFAARSRRQSCRDYGCRTGCRCG
jgi:rhamnosyltransferase subunit B